MQVFSLIGVRSPVQGSRAGLTQPFSCRFANLRQGPGDVAYRRRTWAVLDGWLRRGSNCRAHPAAAGQGRKFRTQVRFRKAFRVSELGDFDEPDDFAGEAGGTGLLE